MGISAKNRMDYFLKELGARKPSPGGGAAAAVSGAVGAALIMKVANYTIRKKKYKKYEKAAKVIIKKAKALKNKLSARIQRDARIYNEYAKTGSRASIKKATSCVAETAKYSKDALKLCARLRRIGNKNLKGDLVAAELFLNASAKAADNLVRLNKKGMGR